MGDQAGLVSAAEELFKTCTTTRSEIEGEIIDIHPDEAIGPLLIHPAA